MKFRYICGLILLLCIAIGFGEFVRLKLKEPYFASPDQLREWNREEFEHYTVPSRFPGEPFPNLAETGPLPKFTVRSESEDEYVVVYSHGQSPGDLDPFFTVIQSDENLSANLPGGGSIQLSTLALTMPEDVPELGQPGKRPKLEDPGWMNPVTRDLLGEDPVLRETPRRFPWSVFGNPTLHLVVENTGGLPVVFLGAELYDAETMSSACKQTGQYFGSGHGEFSLRLDTWHATELLLVVKCAYGEYETRDLPLKKGSHVDFGGQVRVDTVVELPPHFVPTGTMATSIDDPGILEYEQSFDRLDEGQFRDDGNSKPLGVLIWPTWAAPGIDYQNPGSEEWQPASNNSGSLLGTWASEADLAGSPAVLKLRRRPHYAKAVFRLKPLSRLPESKNLFTTPIKKAVFEISDDWGRFITSGAQVNYDLRSLRGNPASVQWPVTLRDTTLLQMLTQLQRDSGIPIYYDEKNHTLSTKEPESLLAPWKRRVDDWWEKIAP